MKKLIATLLCVLAINPILAQSETSTENSKPIQTTDIARYKLYPTQNMWTFIKLDTKTGKIWQVQFSLNEDNRFECVLNSRNLVTMFESEYLSISNGEEVNGRFELYPTQNIYNFILLDKIKGDTYQVQWASDEKDRGLLLIH